MNLVLMHVTALGGRRMRMLARRGEIKVSQRCNYKVVNSFLLAVSSLSVIEAVAPCSPVLNYWQKVKI